MYGIEVMVVSKTGRPLSLMMPLSTDKRVKTRIKQYEAYKTQKGSKIAKTILKSRINSQIALLEKYGLPTPGLIENLNKVETNNRPIDEIRTRLLVLRKLLKALFQTIFSSFPKISKAKKARKIQRTITTQQPPQLRL